MPTPPWLSGPLAALLFAGSVFTPGLTAAQASPHAAAVSSIRLERNCFGCASGVTVELRRDGPSSITQTGNARAGTPTLTRSGVLAPADFDALARLLQARGFFAMPPSYDDPELRDGAWSTITAVRSGHEKQVFGRASAVPAAWREIEQAIEAAGARIDVTPSRP